MAIKTYKRSQNDLSLTKNFKVKEFACKCGKCSTKIDDKLVNFLQKIREHFGQPVTINSGYRCSTHNKKVGGASKSKHVGGMAADIVVKNIQPAEVAKFAESIGILGIGLYDTSKDGHFVHIDTRTSKAFWFGHAQEKRTTFGGSTEKKEINGLVKAFQEAAIKDGFKSVLKSGADGIWGSECEEVAKKAILYKTKYPWRLKNLTKFIQNELGQKADGKFGAGTHSAVINFQKDRGLTADGIVGIKTYKAIVGVK